MSPEPPPEGVRAHPQLMLVWHEIVSDPVGGETRTASTTASWTAPSATVLEL
ncbi:hypothetical protein [Streptomyces sp. NPDC002587]